jgi:AraC-like DNA-binding protein
MAIKVSEVIIIISAFLFMLLSVFLFSQKKGNIRSHKIFAAFLILNALITLLPRLGYGFKEIVYDYFPFFNIIIYSPYFLFGPLLYLYTRSITLKDFRFRVFHLLHLVPFFIDVLFRIYKYITYENVNEILMSGGRYLTVNKFLLLRMVAQVHILVYIGAAIFIVLQYRYTIKTRYSSVEKINLSWLKFILIGFFCIQVIFLVKMILYRFAEIHIPVTFGKYLGNFIFITIIVYKILKQPEIFSGINHNPRYEKSSLTRSDMDKYLKKLIAYMESAKPYLSPDLTLGELAESLSIPSHHLTQTLNTCLHQKFFEFINRYRIEESRRLLTEKKYHKKTILDILYESGFNSKSVFNRLFKKYTGKTPSQYRGY